MNTRSAATTTATGHTPATMAGIKVWYILINPDNVPFGEPLRVMLGHDDDIIKLKTEIKKGAYKDNLANVNITEMEVWRYQSLTLRGLRPDRINELVKNLEFSSDEDSDGQILAGWDTMIELQVQEYEPLVVRVQPKGRQHVFVRIIFPAELSCASNS
jgi:hypothetical protein